MYVHNYYVPPVTTFHLPQSPAVACVHSSDISEGMKIPSNYVKYVDMRLTEISQVLPLPLVT